MAKKIIVVDDDMGNLRLASSILKSKGYEVFTAEDGLDALVQIKKEKPDMVVLDVMMPEINGYDVCYHLRFNKDYEQIPILLVTAREDELEDAIKKREHIDYLQKPYSAETLLAKVDQLLSK